MGHLAHQVKTFVQRSQSVRSLRVSRLQAGIALPDKPTALPPDVRKASGFPATELKL